MAQLTDKFYSNLQAFQKPVKDDSGNFIYIVKGKTKTLLTEAVISDYSVTDGNNLSMLVASKGVKTWIVRFIINGTPKRTSIGTYPTVGLADARRSNEEYQRLAKQGISKTEQKREQKRQTTIVQNGLFHLVAYEWLEVMKTKTEEHTHVKRVRAFERDIFPYFCKYNQDRQIVSSRNIADITHSELLKCIKEKEINAPETAHRLLAI